MAKYKLNQKYAGIWGTDLPTPLCRGQFLNLVEPNRQFTPNKYGITLLADKNDEAGKVQLKAIQTQCNEMLLELTQYLHEKETKEKKTTLSLDQYREQFKLRMKYPFLRDGDTLEKYEGHAGCWVISAKNADIKNVVIPDGRKPEDFKPGMIVRAQVCPYLGPDGFSYTLRVLRLIKDDGVRLGGAVATDAISDLDKDVEAVKTDTASALASLDGDVSGAGVTRETTSEPHGLDVL